MTGRSSNHFNGRFPSSTHFREATHEPGLTFIFVCDEPSTDATLQYTATNGRVKRQPHEPGLAFTILGGVPPKAFLMYGMPQCRRNGRRGGAGHGVFTEYCDAPPDKVRCAAVLMGKRTNERAVLVFVAEEEGSDSLYRMKIPSVGLGDLSAVRDQLDGLGLKYRLFVPEGDSVLVVAVRKAEWDPDDQVPKIVEAMASCFDQDVIEYRGALEYLGSDVSGDER